MRRGIVFGSMVLLLASDAQHIIIDSHTNVLTSQSCTKEKICQHQALEADSLTVWSMALGYRFPKPAGVIKQLKDDVQQLYVAAWPRLDMQLSS